MNRREFLIAAVAVAGGAGVVKWMNRAAGVDVRAEAASTHGSADGPVEVIQFNDRGEKVGPVTVPRIHKPDAEWRKQLTPLQFEVTRKEGTETAFTGAHYNLHDSGIYRCICCGNTLFNSDTKFDSGTGWPSFWAPIAKENVRNSSDSSLGMLRDAVSCAECDAHLGHVFDDGPKPTGLRYCMNSAALKFVKIG